jgi:hypothetical protein
MPCSRSSQLLNRPDGVHPWVSLAAYVIQRGLRQAPIRIGGPPLHPGHVASVPPLTGSRLPHAIHDFEVVLESAEPVVVIVAEQLEIVACRAAADAEISRLFDIA